MNKLKMAKSKNFTSRFCAENIPLISFEKFGNIEEKIEKRSGKNEKGWEQLRKVEKQLRMVEEN